MRQILKVMLKQIGLLAFIRYLALGILSGLFSFLFINGVTRVIGLIMKDEINGVAKEYMIIFSLIILLFVWVRRVLSLSIIKFSQMVSWDLRQQIISAVLTTNYEQLSKKKVEVRSAVLSDVYILTDAAVSIISFTTSTILCIATLAYLATISFILFLITILVASAGSALYYRGSAKSNKDFEQYRRSEDDFLKNLDAILDGFKEIYMEPRIGRAIFEKKIKQIAKISYNINVKAFTGFLNNQITGQILFYLLITSVLLYFHVELKISAGDTVSFVFTLLYLLGSIETIMVLLPNLMKARVASKNIFDLKARLDKGDLEIAPSFDPERTIDFEKIVISNLVFRHEGIDTGFQVGPIEFHCNKNDVIFIYGGNGSGKTTFVNSLIGLFVPSQGNVMLNDIVVNEENYAFYRKHFAAVFSDFYLFSEPYAASSYDAADWSFYFDLFEMEDKVSFVNGCYSTVNLSTGQRKRLALITALMERKPILVLDEWAADQDPYFRKKFYMEIIPTLKKDGLTIIAITHDDKYYHCADVLYKMEYGKLTQQNINHHQNSITLS